MNKEDFNRKPLNLKWFPNSTRREVKMTSRFAIKNGIQQPPPIKTNQRVKLPKLIKSPIECVKKSPVGRVIKKWFPNSTGRDVPMTSRFGIEHNKSCEFLRPTPVVLPCEKSVKIKILPISPISPPLRPPYKREKSLSKRGVWGMNFS
tara:strand:+ start:415 stop:858 length:444 start_codon:yes stop_codon:yes gene_type:complete